MSHAKRHTHSFSIEMLKFISDMCEIGSENEMRARIRFKRVAKRWNETVGREMMRIDKVAQWQIVPYTAQVYFISFQRI